MNRKFFGAFIGLGFAVTACATSTDSGTRGSSSDLAATNGSTDTSSTDSVQTKSVCSGGKVRCYAQVIVGSDGQQIHTAAPSGLGAADLQKAYALDTTLDPGATIAIVDAFGYKNAESDLKAYRAQYGLPACTVASGCLTIINQDGNASPLPAEPSSDDDWTLETALDLDMASAACPKCKLLLVQATTDQDDGLFIAQAAAVAHGATVISNSWGGAEDPSAPATANEHYFDFPNVGIFVAAGDSGYDNGGQGPDYPSTSAHVTAVGGTRLTKSSSGTRGYTEVAWAYSPFSGGGGSSCSLSIPKPSYQGATSCTFRAASDVAANADPSSGPAIYNAGNGGWTSVGGTSAASPLVAGIYALTGHGKEAPGFAYANKAAYYDITSGKNGSCGNVLCNAGTGWDGPTGIGAPNGKALAAIAASN